MPERVVPWLKAGAGLRWHTAVGAGSGDSDEEQVLSALMLINCGQREREEPCIRQELPTPLTGTANEGGRWQEWAARVRWPEVHIKQAGRPRKSRSWLLEPLARLIVWHRSKDVLGILLCFGPHSPALTNPTLSLSL